MLVFQLEMPRLAGGDWRILEIPMAPPSARPAPLTTRFTYLLTNLTSNSSYSLMIRSRNYLGWSKLSEKVTFDTFPSPGKLCLMPDDASPRVPRVPALHSRLASLRLSPRSLARAGRTGPRINPSGS